MNSHPFPWSLDGQAFSCCDANGVKVFDSREIGNHNKLIELVRLVNKQSKASALSQEIDTLKLQLLVRDQPLRWRRFSDEKPKQGQEVLVAIPSWVARPPASPAYYKYTYETKDRPHGEWIPYPLDPAPLPEPKQDACDPEFVAAYATGRTHSRHELEIWRKAWRTAWAKAREQKL